MSRKKTDEFGVAVADDIEIDGAGDMIGAGDVTNVVDAAEDDISANRDIFPEDGTAPTGDTMPQGTTLAHVIRLCNLREEPSPTAKISDVVFAGEEISLVEIVRTETAGEWGRAVAPPHGWISMKNVLVGG